MPAVAATNERFYELAQTNPRYERFADPRLPASIARQLEDSDVEVFFDETSTFILQFAYRSSVWSRRNEPGRPDTGIRIMRVAHDAAGDDNSELAELCELVRKAINSALDGRRVRHWSSSWTAVDTDESPLKDLETRLSVEDVPLTLRKAELDPVLRDAVEALADRRTRDLLIEIAQAAFARSEDVLSKRGKAKDETAQAVESLKAAELIVTEHVVQCKKTSAPLVRLTQPGQLDETSTGDLKCIHCNRRFADESLSEGYSLSATGKSLSHGSHWMTVWTTERLTELGVALESIAWNLEESSEEVDLLFEHLGRLWIVELKDRDFGAGDAHPFNYRRVRYRADEAIVISAGRISSDARRVFEELEKGGGRPRRSESSMILVEGLDQVRPVLEKRFEDAASDRARIRLSAPSAVIGFDLSEVVKRRLSRRRR